MADSFANELYAKSQAELEDYWYFEWDAERNVAANIYNFHDLLKLYGNACRKWEYHHNGHVCLVERVRDKYLMPKIRELAESIRNNQKGE